MKKFIVYLMLILFAGSSLIPLLPNVEAVGAWPAPTDFGSNFQNYTPGTTNPFPWTLTANGGTGQVVGGNGYGGTSALYDFTVTSSGQKPAIEAQFNATSTSINVSGYTNCIEGDAAGLSMTLKVNSSIGTASASHSSGSSCVGSNPDTYTVTILASPGKLVTVQWNVSNTVSSTLNVYLSAFSIIGAAAYTNSQGGPAYNFELYNDSSAGPYWFDPSGYTGSSLSVAFASSSNVSTTWTNAPSSGLSVAAAYIKNLDTAKLVTMWVGDQYSRTLIPNSHVNSLAMYLDNPSTVLSYKISVIGPAGNQPSDFPSGSEIFIQQNNHNITSGYLDSTQGFLAYLVPGIYTVELVNGSATYIGTSVFPDIAGSTVQINVFGAQIKYASGVVTSQSFNLAWNTGYTQVVFTYVDNTSTSTQVGIVIHRYNSSGTYSVYTLYHTLTPGGGAQVYTLDISATSVNLNKNISTQLSAIVYSTSPTFGTNVTVGTMGIPVAICTGCLFPTVNINLPTDVLGLSTVFTFITWQNLLALTLLIFTAAGFGAATSKFGFLALGLEIDLFTAIGWLPPMTFLASLPLFAVTAILIQANKGR